jgi:hypothetical protein
MPLAARQHPLPVSVVAIVKLALVLVDVVLRAVVRGMVRARTEPHVPGPGGVRSLLVAKHSDRLISQILGEMVAFLRRVGLINVAIVFYKIGIPLVCLAAKVAVEAIEALLQRPLAFACARGKVARRDIMIFAQPESAPAAVLQNLRDRGALVWNAGVSARESNGTLDDASHPVQVMVAAGKACRAGRRAERGRVPLRIRQAPVSQLLHRWHIDSAAVRRPCSKSGVVIKNKKNVRRACGSAGWNIWVPIGNGIPNIELDGAFEWFCGHGVELLTERSFCSAEEPGLSCFRLQLSEATVLTGAQCVSVV